MKLEGIKRIAEYMNRSERTVWDYINNRGLPASLVGGVYIAQSEEVDMWSMRDNPVNHGELRTMMDRLIAEIGEIKQALANAKKTSR